MKLKPGFFAIACTCVVLCAPAGAMGVVNVNAPPSAATPVATGSPPAAKVAAATTASPPGAHQGYQAAAMIIAAMVLAAHGIGRRLQ